MTDAFAAPLHASCAPCRFCAGLVSAGVRAEDAPQSPNQRLRATPSGQKPAGRSGARAVALAIRRLAAEPHRLPPDSTTKQTTGASRADARLHRDGGLDPAVRRQGRTAGRYRLHGLSAGRRRSGDPAGDLSLQWRARARPPPICNSARAGPWRLAIEGDAAVSSASPDLMPNAETWLDFTDLVFIDPVGTGYSRFVATGEEVRKQFFSVDGDVNSIAVTIRRWLEKSDRLLLAQIHRRRKLWRHPRTEDRSRIADPSRASACRGLILVSPVLDFREFGGSEPAAICRRACRPWRRSRAKPKVPVTRADMADVEHYAQGDFLADLIKGQADTEATTRLADKVAALTGIDQAVSRRLAGRFDACRVSPRIRSPRRQGDGTL